MSVRVVLVVLVSIASTTPSPRQGGNLTGTITWKHDGVIRSSGASIEHYATMTITVKLKPEPSGLDRAYVDDGSSFTYSASHIHNTASECGVRYRWTETGGGSFDQEGAAIGVTLLGNELLLTAVGPYKISGTGGMPPCSPMEPLDPGNNAISPGCTGDQLIGKAAGQGTPRRWDFACSITLGNGRVTTVSGSLGIGSGVVKAVPGGPYAAVRAERVMLDGSQSEGDNLRYAWTFAPRDCPAGQGGNAAAQRTEPNPSVMLLCSMTATLTVTDGRARDSKTVAINVTPRNWKTGFQHVAAEGEVVGAESPVVNQPGWVGGQNSCAIDPDADDHVLHPARANGTWDATGYELAQVRDSGGPFDSFWYVADYNMRLERQTKINKNLLPDARPIRTRKSFYQANTDHGTDVRGYLAAVRAHEGLSNAEGVLGHSGRMKQALARVDPARRVERSFSTGPKDKLRGTVDALIAEADLQICQAAADPLPLIWQGKLAVAQYGADEWVVVPQPFAVGGPGYPKWACSP